MYLGHRREVNLEIPAFPFYCVNCVILVSIKNCFQVQILVFTFEFGGRKCNLLEFSCFDVGVVDFQHLQIALNQLGVFDFKWALRQALVDFQQHVDTLRKIHRRASCF